MIKGEISRREGQVGYEEPEIKGLYRLGISKEVLLFHSEWEKFYDFSLFTEEWYNLILFEHISGFYVINRL